MRRLISILAVNALLFALGALLLEVAARSYDYGSLGSAVASFVRTEPSRLGTVGRRAEWLKTDPDLGYHLNPEADGANSLGIRGPEVAVPKPADRFRIVVVGDSVAWDENGFVKLLHDRLAGRPEIVNAAIPGYTTYQERVLLERDLLALEPDLVLLQYCLNDNHRFLHYVDPKGHWLVTEEAMSWIVADGDGLLARLTRRSSLVRQIRFAIARPPVVENDRFLAPQNQHFGPAWQEEPWRAAEAHLRAMNQAARARGAAFAIVIAPIREQMIEAWLESEAQWVLKPQRRMAAFTDRESIPLLDLHPAFRGNAPEELFRDPLHFTPRAHEIAARELAAFLDRHELGPPGES